MKITISIIDNDSGAHRSITEEFTSTDSRIVVADVLTSHIGDLLDVMNIGVDPVGSAREWL